MVQSGEIGLKGGGFPLCHVDLMHSNITVDSDYNVLGFIDWDGACTLPWELVTFPLFLRACPPAFESPDQYDNEGLPLDPSARRCWQDRGSYLELVKSYETTGNQRLSEVLEDTRGQGLAYAIGSFTEGKPGLYGRVLDQYVERDS